ncbi:transposase, YhgA-like family protein [Rickettsia endosymbiont of Ixodes pacificus]|nr:transposase, YhgA-like family protein [Rickettsia endosymbiont of Ixodes pacificus]
MHLPKEIQAMFLPHTLKMEKESFVEADLRHSISDILFSAKFNDDTGYFWILLEHQSTPDHFMAFRLFKYMTDIASRHLTLHPKSKYLPFVYPLIFYNGKRNTMLQRIFGNYLKINSWCKIFGLRTIR